MHIMRSSLPMLHIVPCIYLDSADCKWPTDTESNWYQYWKQFSVIIKPVILINISILWHPYSKDLNVNCFPLSFFRNLPPYLVPHSPILSFLCTYLCRYTSYIDVKIGYCRDYILVWSMKCETENVRARAICGALFDPRFCKVHSTESHYAPGNHHAINL